MGLFFKNSKRISSLILALVLIFSMIPDMNIEAKEYEYVGFSDAVFIADNDNDKTLRGKEFTLSLKCKLHTGSSLMESYPGDFEGELFFDWKTSNQGIELEHNNDYSCKVKVSEDAAYGDYSIGVDLYYLSNGTKQYLNNCEYSFAVLQNYYYVDTDLEGDIEQAEEREITAHLKYVDEDGSLCRTIDDSEVAFNFSINQYEYLQDNLTVIKHQENNKAVIRRGNADKFVLYICASYLDQTIYSSYTIPSTDRDVRLYSDPDRDSYVQDQDINLIYDLENTSFDYDEIQTSAILDTYVNGERIEKEISEEISLKTKGRKIYITIDKSVFDDANFKWSYNFSFNIQLLKEGEILVKNTHSYGITYGGQNSNTFNNLDELILSESDTILAEGILNKYDMNYNYVVKSVEIASQKPDTEGENVIYLEKTIEGYKYTALNKGTATLRICYDYTDDDIVQSQDYNLTIKVSDEKYDVSYEYDHNTSDYGYTVIVGSYIDIIPSVTRKYYDYSTGKILTEKVDCTLDIKDAYMTYYDIKYSCTPIGNNTYRLAIDKDSIEGFCPKDIYIYDSNGNEIIRQNILVYAYKTIYRTGFYYDKKSTLEPGEEVILTPYLKLIDAEHPLGIDLDLNNYDFRIETFSESIIDPAFELTDNKDGTYTVKSLSSSYGVIESYVYEKGNSDRFLARSEIGFRLNRDSTIAKVKGSSATILNNGNFALNFFVDVPVNEVSNMQVKIDTINNIKPENVPSNTKPLSDFELLSSENGINHYKISYPVNAAEMNTGIGLLVYNSKGKYYDIVYSNSLVSYARRLLSDDSGKYGMYENFIKSILNYGAYSQKYFEVDTDKLANASLGFKDKILDDIPQDIITSYSSNTVASLSSLSYYGTSLLLKDEIVMRHYFMLQNDEDINNYSATLNGKKLSIKKNGGLYYVDITGISPKDLNKTINLAINKGTSTVTLDYSPFNYIVKAYTKSDSDIKLKELMNALYWYNVNASDF